MRQMGRLRSWRVGLVVALAVTVLVGCGGGETAPADDGRSGTHASAVLDTSYAGALDVPGQLALGTLTLEATDGAITPDQAGALLPLWRALQGSVTAEAEVSAVLKQIEERMTAEQLAAIAAMQLTQPGRPPGVDAGAWRGYARRRWW